MAEEAGHRLKDLISFQQTAIHGLTACMNGRVMVVGTYISCGQRIC